MEAIGLGADIEAVFENVMPDDPEHIVPVYPAIVIAQPLVVIEAGNPDEEDRLPLPQLHEDEEESEEEVEVGEEIVRGQVEPVQAAAQVEIEGALILQRDQIVRQPLEQVEEESLEEEIAPQRPQFNVIYQAQIGDFKQQLETRIPDWNEFRRLIESQFEVAIDMQRTRQDLGNLDGLIELQKFGSKIAILAGDYWRTQRLRESRPEDGVQSLDKTIRTEDPRARNDHGNAQTHLFPYINLENLNLFQNVIRQYFAQMTQNNETSVNEHSRKLICLFLNYALFISDSYLTANNLHSHPNYGQTKEQMIQLIQSFLMYGGRVVNGDEMKLFQRPFSLDFAEAFSHQSTSPRMNRALQRLNDSMNEIQNRQPARAEEHIAETILNTEIVNYQMIRERRLQNWPILLYLYQFYHEPVFKLVLAFILGGLFNQLIRGYFS